MTQQEIFDKIRAKIGKWKSDAAKLESSDAFFVGQNSAYSDVLLLLEALEPHDPQLTIRGWVARQPEGGLFIFSDEPYFDNESELWGTGIGEHIELSHCNTKMFADLQYTDEPIEVELTIRKI